MQKVQKEVGEKHKDSIVQHIGSFLIEYIRNHPEHAAFILTDGKDISGSYKFMESEARKSQKKVMSDQEGFNLVLKYFGVPVNKPTVSASVSGLKASIDDLL